MLFGVVPASERREDQPGLTLSLIFSLVFFFWEEGTASCWE